VRTRVGTDFALLGNATEFLDPVFSSGVTRALESANRAAKIRCRQLAGERVGWAADYARHLMQGVDSFRTYVQAWYDDRLPTIFFSPVQPPEWRAQICSVLAGNVWDLTKSLCARLPPRRRYPRAGLFGGELMRSTGAVAGRRAARSSAVSGSGPGLPAEYALYGPLPRVLISAHANAPRH